ncbi:2OG-Fe(II) oxygenase [Synechococcus sp. CBW1107]|uniref:2OG-Fe(II) oxygenase n=1 Tax=Synechococcus sp. CBW1107 TaxID=2789857 RepID=UPI0018CE1519|nr:2OG-Fe(II) oxygenase [Synechococcus sp. CBW1107]QPN56546.1 2OG-Fe(II) oxygenase [Synechococcus sp. CBW1107]
MKLKRLPGSIAIVDEALPQELCRRLIALFLVSGEGISGRTEFGVHPIKRSIDWDIEASKNASVMGPVQSLESCLERAYEIALDDRHFPLNLLTSHYLLKRTAFVLQCYTDASHGFDWHVDSTPPDNRVLAGIAYLNSVEVGGETQFRGADAVAAVEGRVLLFPPFWTHVHRGCPPISGPKYVITWFVEAYPDAAL